MSGAYYTSYQTSLSLREAGAEQRPHDVVMTWDAEDGDEPILIDSLCSEADSPRAFRLDEILVALESYGHPQLWMPCKGHWQLQIWIEGRCQLGSAATPVEAAAACYLAVLRAGSEVAR